MPSHGCMNAKSILIMTSSDIIVAILRIYYLVNTSYSSDADFLWISTNEFIWSIIEPSLGVMVACAPVLGSLLRQYFPKMKPRSSERTGPSVGQGRFGHATKAGHVHTTSSPMPAYDLQALSSSQKVPRTVVEDDEILLNPFSTRRSQGSGS